MPGAFVMPPSSNVTFFGHQSSHIIWLENQTRSHKTLRYFPCNCLQQTDVANCCIDWCFVTFMRNSDIQSRTIHIRIVDLFDDNKIKMARKHGKKMKENTVGCTREGRR